MTRIRNMSKFYRSWTVAVLVAFCLSCGAERPAPPPRPPAPPPFQPQIVVIDLGSHGGKTTVVSTQTGGWTRNGEAFSSGSTVIGENGANYKLTLSDSQWTAAFVPPEPVSVTLGNSRDTVSVEIQEDGSYILAGEPLGSGDLRQSPSGRQYRFTMEDGGPWRAEYVVPGPVLIQLGASGDTAPLLLQENGTYTLDGTVLGSGQVREAPNGNRYRFTQQPDGTWAAAYLAPAPAGVPLGGSGSLASVETQENGTFVLDGRILVNGQVREAPNGNRYRFTLSDGGTWTAAFVPPAPVSVTLGISGFTASLERLENGSYSLDGEVLVSGQIRTAINDNRYRFTFGNDGKWTAEFVASPPITVHLGASSDSVSVTRLENRSYELAGEPLISGAARTFGNNQYRFTLRLDGTWRADFIPELLDVPLGTTGGSIRLVRQENGDFYRGGSVFASGETVTGRSGSTYRLTFVDGRWIAEHVPQAVSVTVPDGEVTITLVLREDGEYLHDGNPVRHGDEITVGESTFELEFVNGRWTAVFVEGRVSVELGRRGDSITLVRLPDGTYEYNGRTVRSGQLIRSPETGIRYRLSLRNGEWSSSAYVPPSIDGGDTGFVETGTTATLDDLEEALPSGFLRDANGNIKAADALLRPNQADAADTDYSRFRGGGSVQAETFVEAARKVIQNTVNAIKPLVERGEEADKFVARVLLKQKWESVRDALSRIFSPVNGKSAGELLLRNLPSDEDSIDEEDRLEDLEVLLETLESRGTFESELAESGLLGQFGIFSTAEAEAIYTASKGSLAIGATENTRFGVIAELEPNVTAQQVGTSSGGTLPNTAAFAYSPLSASMTASLPSRGTARYVGRTLGVERDGDLYSGAITLNASLGIERIVTEVTGLSNTETGSRWVHDNKAVSRIQLPEIGQADLEDSGKFEASGNPMSMIVYDEHGGLFQANAISTYVGQFVGRPEQPGEEVIGTWVINDDSDLPLIKGAFGADRQSTSRAVFPSSDNDGLSAEFRDTNSRTILDLTDHTMVVNGRTSTKFVIGTLYGRNSISTLTGSVGNQDYSISLRYRNTRFTRFGAWADTAGTTVTRGVFGYATLAETRFDGTVETNNIYPRNVSAVYNGRTVAVSPGGTLYDGEYILNVAWDDESIGGMVTAVIRGLRVVNGGSPFQIGGDDVNQIGFTDTIESGGSTFSDPASALVQYTSGGPSTPLQETTHSGHFLGSSGVDGPFAVIGDWSVTINGSRLIEGEFGADLVPAP